MNKIKIIDAGNGGEMDKAYRAGTGQFIHQQGPAPQQLEADGVGHVVTALGPVIGACGFSSLAARPEWLESEEAKAFTRAYIKTRNYMNDASAAEIAAAENRYSRILMKLFLQTAFTHTKTWGSGPDILILLMKAIMRCSIFLNMMAC